MQHTNPQAWIQGGEDSPHPGYDAYDDLNPDVLDFDYTYNSEDSSFSSCDQTKLAPERIKNWPFTSDEVDNSPFAENFKKVRTLGLPNERGVKIQIPTKLNIKLWESSATSHPDDDIVLSGVKYGFSMQYVGPTLSEVDIEMHESGRRHVKHIEEYFDTEKKYGAIVGPFRAPHFTLGAAQAP